MNKLKTLLRRTGVVLAVLFVLAALLYTQRSRLADAIDARYAAVAARASFPFAGCSKVWAHRGYVLGGAPENSIASVQAAFALGAAGVEVDILYDRHDERFYVSHDHPYQTFDGQPLTLAALLAATGDAGHFWLDAKNLENLAPWHAKRAVSQLAALLDQHGLRERAFVESRHPVYLSWVAAAGLHTSLMVSPNERKYSPAVYAANVYLMKWAYSLGPFGAISMTHSRYTPRTASLFGERVPVLLSTVNDDDRLAALQADPRVRVILTDNNRFASAACAGEAAPH